MKNSKLSNLLSKIQELSTEASDFNDFSIETINDELSRNLKGGVYENSNGSCDNSNNTSCSNGSCAGSTNKGCANGSCLPAPAPVAA